MRKYFNHTTLLIFLVYPMMLISKDNTLSIRSHAYDFNSGKYLYSENHKEYYENGKHIYSIVKYKDPSEKTLAKKKIEFGKKKTQPDFFLEDYRTGYTDQAKLINPQNQTFELEHQRSKSKPKTKKTIKVPGIVVVDGGFDYFIRENFSTLTQGNRIRGNFVLTNRLDYFQCRVYKTKDLKYRERDAVQFVLQPENFVIRAIADKIIVTYDKKSKRLLEYVGISNIQNNAGDDFPKVKIIFQYKNEELDNFAKSE